MRDPDYDKVVSVGDLKDLGYELGGSIVDLGDRLVDAIEALTKPPWAEENKRLWEENTNLKVTLDASEHDARCLRAEETRLRQLIRDAEAVENMHCAWCTSDSHKEQAVTNDGGVYTRDIDVSDGTRTIITVIDHESDCPAFKSSGVLR